MAERRFNPLRDEWVVVSPQRTERPWQGQIERPAVEDHASYDPQCYLCPGNERAHGLKNPHYTSTFAFDNDFPALEPPAPSPKASTPSPQPPAPSPQALAPSPQPLAPSPDFFLSESEPGICRVICFSPRHDVTLPRMETAAVRAVVDAWIDEYTALSAMPGINYAVVFENRGAMMGASNPHPHGQIWATGHVPNEPAREQAALATYRSTHGTCLLCDYAAHEIRLGARVVCVNDAFVALVPFWAVWPFETLVISRRHVGAIPDLNEAERNGLADIMKRLTTRYDNLFEAPFPYSMGFHQTRPGSDPHSHLHAHFYPPLLRSATIRKFMVGFELLGSPQRDLTPEEAAEKLQAVSDTHYSTRVQEKVR